jgi:hypothetical protein
MRACGGCVPWILKQVQDDERLMVQAVANPAAGFTRVTHNMIASTRPTTLTPVIAR